MSRGRKLLTLGLLAVVLSGCSDAPQGPASDAPTAEHEFTWERSLTVTVTPAGRVRLATSDPHVCLTRIWAVSRHDARTVQLTLRDDPDPDCDDPVGRRSVSSPLPPAVAPGDVERALVMSSLALYPVYEVDNRFRG